MGFKILLENMMMDYLRNWKTLKEKAKNKDYKWLNEYMPAQIGNKATCFSKTCRMIIENLIYKGDLDYVVLAFLYSFCFNDPTPTTAAAPTYIRIPRGFTIDLLSKKGVFIYNEELHRYELFQKPVGKETLELAVEENLTGLFSGFTILYGGGATEKYVPIRQLEEIKHTMSAGEAFNTTLNGEKYLMVRDPTSDPDIKLTITRRLHHM